MSHNKTLPAMVAFLIVRDKARQAAFAKALETLGVNREQYTMRLDGSAMASIFSGSAPFNDGTVLVTKDAPERSFPNPMAPERPEEFAPGLGAGLQAVADALTGFREEMVKPKGRRKIS